MRTISTNQEWGRNGKEWGSPVACDTKGLLLMGELPPLTHTRHPTTNTRQPTTPRSSNVKINTLSYWIVACRNYFEKILGFLPFWHAILPLVR